MGEDDSSTDDCIELSWVGLVVATAESDPSIELPRIMAPYEVEDDGFAEPAVGACAASGTHSLDLIA